MYAGFSTWISGGKEPWTLKNETPDSGKTGNPADYPEIDYPKPDNKLSFSLLDNLSRSGVYHEDDQPAHLRVKEGCDPVKISLHKDCRARETPQVSFLWPDISRNRCACA